MKREQKREQNHVKKISIIHLNNSPNNQELKIYSSKRRNILNTPEIINNNIKNTSYNTISDACRVSKRIYKPKLSSDKNNEKIERVSTDILEPKYIYKREINLNRNQYDKIELSKNSNNNFLSYNYSTSNSFEKKNDIYKNNSSIHIINQSKKNKESDNKNKDNILKNNTTIFISGSSKHNKVKSDLNQYMPDYNIIKSKTINKDNTSPKKAQTPLISLIKNKYQQKNDLNIGKEENRVKFSRRLEITEKTEVLLPNQKFKPFEQYEKKENPIIEIKKNIDGKNIRTIKETLIKTTIKNSIINTPNSYIVKNSSLPKVTLIKKKTTKEYITKIKFYSNSIDLNKNSNIINKFEQQRKNNSIHQFIDIKNEKQIINENKTNNKRPSNPNVKNEANIITNEKESNNEPKVESGKTYVEKNNILKTTEKSKRNIKNTVYSNVINNNINKSHKRNNSNKASNINKSKINNIIRRNIQNNNYNTINNETRKINLNIYNGINNEQENISNKYNKNSSNTKENTSNNKNTNKLFTENDFNYFQGVNNESQLLSEIVNLNGSMNNFTVSDSKLSSKILFDIPTNLDFDKNEIIDKNEEKKDIIKEKLNMFEEKINKNENKYNKYQKLNEFINEFNDDEKKDNFNLNNNAPKGDKTSSDEIKSPILDSNQNDEKLNQMQISNINLSLKECEENETDDINNISNGENTNNIDNKNITGSIMFINSNIDKNIHIQNGLENYSINMDANNSTDNFNIIECENNSKNNEQAFINKLESIKNKINNKQKKELDNEQEIIENNDIDEKNLENEYDIGNEEKFFNPLTKYENRFNLDQINPF